MITINIGNKTYNVREAKTKEERIQGLQGIEQLPENEGMLFYFESPQDVSMWMKDVKIPLDIIYIDEDQEVIHVYKAKPNNTKKVTISDTLYVLEVNKDSGIKEGDELEFDGDAPVMKVLFQDGSEQYPLWGGERIFRRPFTKQLIEWVKKADSIKDNEEEFNKICKRIGKKMFKEIKAQDTRPAEYVQAPD